MDKSLIESAKQHLRQKQDEIWDAHDSQPTPELFHYTSAEGFRGIIESRQLWCTDIRHVNDPREGDHGFSVLKSVLNRKSVYKPFKDVIINLDSLFGMKRQWTSYIACFCAAGEKADIWQDYAKGGTGCALVFHFDGLFSASNRGDRYSLFRVLYEQETQTRQVEQTVDHAIHLEHELDITGRKQRMQYWFEVGLTLLGCAIRFKDPMWRHEQEVRLWVAGGSQVSPFEAFGKPRVSVEFEASSLKSVIRGRAAADTLSVDKMTDLLRQHNLGMIPVVESAM
jgi:hypothetical protein